MYNTGGIGGLAVPTALYSAVGLPVITMPLRCMRVIWEQAEDASAEKSANRRVVGGISILRP